MYFDPQLLKEFRAYLPALNESEEALIRDLPEEYYIHVPYFSQEKMHWSGAAVAQMIQAFHGRAVPSQAQIATDANLDDWKNVNHESLKEDFVRYMARHNFVPAVYYPGRYVLPQFANGVMGADYIAKNYELVNHVGFEYFKALIVASKGPAMVRIHFHTGMYPMPEDMASTVDTCGHALLLVGYNKRGFIVHDPWDRSAWGGSHGGKDICISYEELAMLPTVNCCLGCIEMFVPLEVKFDYPRYALHQNREIELVLKINAPGIFGITSSIYPITNLRAQLSVGGKIVIKTNPNMSSSMASFASGQSDSMIWRIETGPDRGSFPVEALVRGTLLLNAFPWETGALKEEITIHGRAQRRLDIKDIDWLNKYGRY